MPTSRLARAALRACCYLCIGNNKAAEVVQQAINQKEGMHKELLTCNSYFCAILICVTFIPGFVGLEEMTPRFRALILRD